MAKFRIHLNPIIYEADSIDDVNELSSEIMCDCEPTISCVEEITEKIKKS